MKNSSRLVAEIDRNRSRSSSGWLALVDSSNTLRLNSSHDNSRLMNRSGEDNRAGCSSFVAITAADDPCCFFVATAGAKQNLPFHQENIDPITTRRKRGGAACLTVSRRRRRRFARNRLGPVTNARVRQGRADRSCAPL